MQSSTRRHGDRHPPTCEYRGKKTIYTPSRLPSFKLQPNLPPEPHPLGNRHLSPFSPPPVSPGYAPRRKRWRPAEAVLDRRAVTVTDESGDSFCPLVVQQQQLVFPHSCSGLGRQASLLHLGHFFTFLLFPLCVFLGCYHFACCWLVGGTFVGGGGRSRWTVGGASDGTRRVRLRPLPPGGR